MRKEPYLAGAAEACRTGGSPRLPRAALHDLMISKCARACMAVRLCVPDGIHLYVRVGVRVCIDTCAHASEIGGKIGSLCSFEAGVWGERMFRSRGVSQLGLSRRMERG